MTRDSKTPEPVVASVDGSAFTPGVCAYAAWLAGRMETDVEVLHLDDRLPKSGARATAATLQGYVRVAGEKVMSAAAHDVVRAGGELSDLIIGQGDFAEVAVRISESAAGLVMGLQGGATPCYSARLGSNVRRLAGRSRSPLLLTPMDFRPIHRALILYNAGFPDEALARCAASHPCLDGLDCDLLGFGRPTRGALSAFTVSFPDAAIEKALAARSYDLIVLPRCAGDGLPSAGPRRPADRARTSGALARTRRPRHRLRLTGQGVRRAPRL